ncbi:hypothetical protein A3J33_02235 [candidate division WWE3 bacterium RIFCSPLOWO2_02_FULL_53_10]|uniref:Uncharacterized protein n=2 Tax=Katanobacteria TaxID=422282 RepID=A0A1F4WL88_UNCKA|nr:MAG: hypothetical protein A2890_00500 [candidate division WWE3 bacterium RIFCSPLOWO2_01_FULL_53_14]OGC70118.1 MAG: hypothetical protein A3J33_02235 [candidate division WWE3 bacterium RIFCSPLOWO2_02_FULL_53_10]
MAFNFNPFAWLKNASVVQVLMAVGATITSVVVLVAVIYVYTSGLYKTLPIIGDPNLKTFADLWDEAAEISDEVRMKVSYMSDISASPTLDCGAALVSAQEVLADMERADDELDKFDGKIPGLGTAGGNIAASDARTAAGKLVTSAGDWSGFWHELIPAGKQVVELEIDKIKALAAVGCITTDPEQLARAIEAIIPFAESQLAIINSKLMPFLNSDRLQVSSDAHLTAIQDFVGATGITLKLLSSPTAAELGL